MIKLINVKKEFDEHVIIDNISFEVASHELLVLLGSSGSGKTTTLKLINRLIEPTAGVIEINGKDTKQLDRVSLRRSIGYVFQGVGLFPHMTIEENIALVLKLKGIPKIRCVERAHHYMTQVQLDPLEFSMRYPAELSGGQAQRVGVARALATESDILLMDEPFGALDTINRNALQEVLLEIKQRLSKTIVFVTHDIFEALRLGDRIAVLNAGKIEQIGSKSQIVQQPKTEFIYNLFNQTSKQLQHYLGLLNA